MMNSTWILALILVLIPLIVAQKKGRSSSGGSPKDKNEYINLVNVLGELRDIKKDNDVVCKALSTSQADLKLNVTKGHFEYEDLLRLLTWSLKYDLKSGKSLTLRPELKWKREIIDLNADIFKKGCPSEYVSEGFINVVKEVFMIYLNSVKTSKSTKEKWAKTLKTLKNCQSKINPLKMSSRGFLAEYLYMKPMGGADGEEVPQDILIPAEVADMEVPLIDLYIDTVWWMFSFSFAICKPYMEDQATELAQYKKLFYNDFLFDLTKQWQMGGESYLTKYGPVFGDLNLGQAWINLRFCVTAAYTINGIADRQLVRPFLLMASDLPECDNENMRNCPMNVQNRKTGDPLRCLPNGICCLPSGICNKPNF